MRKIILILILIAPSFNSFSQDNIDVRTYGGDFNDYGSEIIETSDGGYMIIGTTGSYVYGQSNIYLLKLDQNLDKEWSSVFGGENIEWGQSIIEITDGYLLLGYTNSFGSGGYDVYLIKCDSMGNIVWENTYGGSNWDFGYKLLKHNDRIYIAGESWSDSAGESDGFLVEINEAGTLIWEGHMGGAENDVFYDLFSADDKVIAIGTSNSVGEYSRIFITELDGANNDSQFTLGEGNEHFEGKAGFLHSNGNYFIAGSKTNNGTPDYLIMELNQDLSIPPIYSNTFGLQQYTDIAYSAVEVGAGQITLIGESSSYTGSTGIYTLRCTQDGNYIAGPTHGGGAIDIGRNVIVNSENQLMIVGETNSFGTGNYDVYVLRFDDDLVDQEYQVNESFYLDSLLTSTGIEATLTKDLALFYPNPARDIIFLVNTKHQWKYAAIFDLKGRLVQRFSLTPHVELIEIDLANGNYILELGDNQISQRARIVVQK